MVLARRSKCSSRSRVRRVHKGETREDAEALIDEAVDLAFAGQFREAAALVEPITRSSYLPPATRVRAWRELAWSRFYGGRRRRGLATITRALEKAEFQPWRSELLTVRGKFLGVMGRVREAEGSLREALSADRGEQEEAYATLVELLYNEGRLDEAELLQAENLAKAPPEMQSGESRVYAALLVGLQRLPEALAWATRAGEVAGSDWDQLSSKLLQAYCHESLGQMDEAVELLTEVVEARHDQFNRAAWELASLLLKLGRVDDALKALAVARREGVDQNTILRVQAALMECRAKGSKATP